MGKVLIDGQYIAPIDGEQLSSNQEVAGIKYYVLGPRTFIDLKSFIPEQTSNECLLCSDYVMFKGFKCGKCPNIMHEKCIREYFESVNSGSFKCPSCQNAVHIDNVGGINSCVHLLAHPNDCIKIIQEMKQIKVQNEEKQQDIEMAMEQSDDEDDSV